MLIYHSTTATGPSPIRQVDGIGPVKGINNNDLICGHGAQKAELTIPAHPGSNVSFQWVGSDGNSVSVLSLSNMVDFGIHYFFSGRTKLDPSSPTWPPAIPLPVTSSTRRMLNGSRLIRLAKIQTADGTRRQSRTENLSMCPSLRTSHQVNT